MQTPQWAVDLREQIAELYNSGVRRKDIEKELGLSKWQYTHHMRRLRDEGRIHDDAIPVESFRAVMYRFKGVSLGRLAEIFLNTNRGFVRWVKHTVEDEGYENVSEFMRDVLLEEYHRRKQKGQNND